MLLVQPEVTVLHNIAISSKQISMYFYYKFNINKSDINFILNNYYIMFHYSLLSLGPKK